MARITDRAITFTEAKSMASETTGDHQYLIELKSIPTSLQCMTSEDIIEYLNVDTSYSVGGKSFSNYSNKRLVPYQLVKGAVRDCIAASMQNQGYGIYTYFVDLGSGTGITRLNYDAQNAPDAFIIEWNNQVVNSGWVGSSTFGTIPDTHEDNTGEPSTGEGSIYLKKTEASPNMAKITVDASASTGTVWTVGQVRCPIPFEIREVNKTASSVEVEWDTFTADPQDNPNPRSTPKYTIACLIDNPEGLDQLYSQDVPIGSTSYNITGIASGATLKNLRVYYHDQYGGSVDTTNQLTVTTDAIGVSPTSIDIPAKGGGEYVSVTASGAWTLTHSASIQVDKTSGNGNDMVYISLPFQNTGEYTITRYVDFTASSGGNTATVTVRHLGIGN